MICALSVDLDGNYTYSWSNIRFKEIEKELEISEN